MSMKSAEPPVRVRIISLSSIGTTSSFVPCTKSQGTSTSSAVSMVDSIAFMSSRKAWLRGHSGFSHMTS